MPSKPPVEIDNQGAIDSTVACRERTSYKIMQSASQLFTSLSLLSAQCVSRQQVSSLNRKRDLGFGVSRFVQVEEFAGSST